MLLIVVLTPPSKAQVLPTVGEHACQVRATSDPAAHWALAWLITLCRLATSAGLNIMSPPHRPGHCPVMSWAIWEYCNGALAGSLLCWPETTLVPVIDLR